MKSLMIFVGLFSLTTLAQADIAYMQEWNDQKHIIVQDDNQKIRYQTQDTLWHIYPDLSSDGQKLIYVEGTDAKNLKLALVDLNTKNKITWEPEYSGQVLHPKFSKNGKIILFSAPDQLQKNRMFLIDSEKLIQGQQAQMLQAQEEVYFPRPSSDGQFIVYQRNQNNIREVVLWDRIADTKKVIAEGMAPALSFDERLIAFTKKDGTQWNIYIYDRIQQFITKATDDAANEMAPTFNKNNELFFASDKTGKFQIYDAKFNLVVQEAKADLYSPQFSGSTRFIQNQLPAFIGPARSSFGSVVHEGYVYMCGGHQGAEHTYPPESFTNECARMNIQNQKWEMIAPRPSLAHGYQIVAYKNYIYAFGGFAYSANHKPGWKSLSQIERYNITTNTWEPVGNLTSPRSSNVAILVGSKVYVIGGWNSTPKSENDFEGEFLSHIDILDLETHQVVRAPYSIPNPLRRAFTGVNYKDKVLLVGGLGVGSTHFELLDSVTELDPTTGQFTELAKLPFATFAPAAEVIEDELFVFGGMFKMGEWEYEYVSHVYGMNLKTQVWSHTGRSLSETKGFSQALKLDDKTIGILGGHHYFQGYDSPVSTFETFQLK